MKYYSIKFRDLEQRENFRTCCEYLGWNLYLLIGSLDGWCLLETYGEEDDTKMVNFLHSLGAFKLENEN